MRVTIIVDDNVVLVQGIPCMVDCSALVAQGIHAVQWYDTSGEIEYSADPRTGQRQPNRGIGDISPFQPLIEAWTAEARKPLPQRPAPPPTPAG
jgi:hypothetical protein